MDNELLKQIYEILNVAGYTFPATCPNGYLCIIDPTCVWPLLLDFIKTAWIILAVITGFLLAGLGITMVRGANHDMVQNLRTLVLIFGSLSVAIPIVNLLGAGDVIVGQCQVIQISQNQAQELLQMRNNNKLHQETYEVFEIMDSALDTPQEIPEFEEEF